jgi:site-specific DNA recombinase
MIPCVAYAAKSSPDEKDSTGSQLEAVREAIEKAGGRTLVQEFHEENVSGYKGERGRALESAMTAARKLAAEHGEAELWVWHSSRLARGDGVAFRGADLIVPELRLKGVTVRSTAASDDAMITTRQLVGIVAEQNTAYSRDLSQWVREGKDRQFRAGQRLGGKLNDGLARVVTLVNNVPVTRYEADPDRLPVIERLFELTESGKGDPSVARTLNTEGYRTKQGNAWTRRAVQQIATNPVYAGRIARRRGKPDEVVAQGTNFPALIDPARFDAIQGARKQRDRAAAGREAAKGGRPTTRYVLSRLATCARCGSRMYCSTSPYKRKDGTQRRFYLCASVHGQTGLCDAPRIPAETADATIVPHLRSFFVDFESWLDGVTTAESADRETVTAQIADLKARLGTLKKAETGAHDRYAAALAEGDDTRAEAIETALARFKSDGAQLAAAIGEQEAALNAVTSVAAPADRLLDFFNDLSAGVRGRLDASESVAEINGALRDTLAEVRLDTLEDGRIQLLPIFDDRDDWEFGGNPGPPAYPNVIPIMAGAGPSETCSLPGRRDATDLQVFVAKARGAGDGTRWYRPTRRRRGAF